MWFDISRPLRELRGDLEKKLKTNLESYRLCLQDKENLNNNTVLEEGEERVVQVSIEITRESSGRVGKINIVDVKEMVPDSDTEAEESEETVTPKEVQVRDVENVEKSNEHRRVLRSQLRDCHLWDHVRDVRTTG